MPTNPPDRVYWRVDPGSPVLHVIEACDAKAKAFKAAMKALGEEFSAEVHVYSDGVFAGLGFAGDPPVGWKFLKSLGCSVPDRRCKAGKQLDRRINDLPRRVSSRGFASMLGKIGGGEYTYWGDDYVYFTSLSNVGGERLLGVPAKCDTNPPGCTRLKMSEYWTLRESSEARNAS